MLIIHKAMTLVVVHGVVLDARC